MTPDQKQYLLNYTFNPADLEALNYATGIAAGKEVWLDERRICFVDYPNLPIEGGLRYNPTHNAAQCLELEPRIWVEWDGPFCIVTIFNYKGTHSYASEGRTESLLVAICLALVAKAQAKLKGE